MANQQRRRSRSARTLAGAVRGGLSTTSFQQPWFLPSSGSDLPSSVTEEPHSPAPHVRVACHLLSVLSCSHGIYRFPSSIKATTLCLATRPYPTLPTSFPRLSFRHGALIPSISHIQKLSAWPKDRTPGQRSLAGNSWHWLARAAQHQQEQQYRRRDTRNAQTEQSRQNNQHLIPPAGRELLGSPFPLDTPDYDEECR